MRTLSRVGRGAEARRGARPFLNCRRFYFIFAEAPNLEIIIGTVVRA